MPLSLTPSTSTDTLSIELDGIVPDRLAGLSTAQIARLSVCADGAVRPLGELFAIRGDCVDGRIICSGDFSRVHRVAAGMRHGAIEVRGSVGRHAGAGMAGGRLEIAGDAGDWIAAEMTGGTVRVDGNAGDNAAAALPGSRMGVRGGLIVINGAVGHLAAARMRRGILAVGGSCGEGAAFELLAGTVIVAGPVGRRPGLGMRRGSLIALSTPPEMPPTFRRGAAWCPGILPLLGRRLTDAGFQPSRTAGAGGAFRTFAGVWQQWHGDLLAGGRGEIFHRPAG